MLRDVPPVFFPLFCILPRPPSGAKVRLLTTAPRSRLVAGLRPGVEPGPLAANSAVLPSEPSVLPGPWGSNITSPPFTGSAVLAEERTLAGRLEFIVIGEGLLEITSPLDFGRFNRGSEFSFPRPGPRNRFLLFLLFFFARFPCSIFSKIAFFSACLAKTV